jgi:CheY-like chemotaxis protein
MKMPGPNAHARSPDSARILYADDDPDVRRLCATTLARAGYSVTGCEDGLDAWDALCSGSFDLVITDNEMPRLTGLQLAARARQAGLDLPIILASGSIHLLDARDYGALAFAALLPNPFGPDQFLETVAQVLRSAPAEARATMGSKVAQ